METGLRVRGVFTRSFAEPFCTVGGQAELNFPGSPMELRINPGALGDIALQAVFSLFLDDDLVNVESAPWCPSRLVSSIRSPAEWGRHCE